MSVMNFQEFEEQELERFMLKFYKFSDVRDIVVTLKKTDYPVVREETKLGIQDGKKDFLAREASAGRHSDTIYLADLASFSLDDAVNRCVSERIGRLNFVLQHAPDYARDVRGAFAVFVYNESYKRFVATFPQIGERARTG